MADNKEEKSLKKIKKGEKILMKDFYLPEKVSGGLKLNVGSGRNYRPDCINIDKYDKTADMCLDIVDGLPFNDNSVDKVLAYAILEHLGMFEVRDVLNEFHRVLKSDGILSIQVPDLQWVCEQIVKEPTPDMIHHLYGCQAHDGEFHKNGFTVDRLTNLLMSTGFGEWRVAKIMNYGTQVIFIEVYA